MARRKTDKATDIVDQIALAWLSERWLKLVADTQRDVAELLSDFDVMWQHNAFAQLRDAIIEQDQAAVDEVLDEKMHRFNTSMTDVREKLLDLRAVIKSVPEVYGGNGNDDAG